MEAIKNTVINVMGALAVKKTQDPDDNPQGWLKKALTKGEREHIKVDYFKNGILRVNVDSSSWLYSLTLKKEGILSRIAKFSTAVKEIRFRMGEVK